LSDRIDGWKAIAAHLGRDRSTAIRWYGERQLPVRRVPGGKKASVYALRSELDLWIRGQSGVDLAMSDPDHSSDTSADTSTNLPPLPPLPPQVVENPAVAPPAGKRRGLVLLGAGLAVVLAIGLWWAVPFGGRAAALPQDPALAQAYLDARENWAARTPQSLARARTQLETITRSEPGFAPAFAALADVYLLSQEFGDMDRRDAFHRARLAAEAGLELDDTLADAHRAMGFVRYWSDRDPVRSGDAFRRAIELAPDVAQTHFWYGNVLVDNGQYVPGLQELNRARLLEPGSVAIQTDYGWALWSAGQDAEARTLLERLARTNPDFLVIFDCLSVIHLADQNIHAFARDFARYADLRGESADIALSRKVAAVLSSQGEDAAWKVLIAGLASQADGDSSRDHSFPAFAAAMRGDRVALAQILAAAEARGENWGSAGMTWRIRKVADGDAELLRLLDNRSRALVTAAS